MEIMTCECVIPAIGTVACARKVKIDSPAAPRRCRGSRSFSDVLVQEVRTEERKHGRPIVNEACDAQTRMKPFLQTRGDQMNTIKNLRRAAPYVLLIAVTLLALQSVASIIAAKWPPAEWPMAPKRSGSMV